MKGLSNNKKSIATLFLFVCLAANSQVFQSNLKSNLGSSSLAQSIHIEDSAVLPENVENWTNVEGTPTEGNHNSADRIEGIGEAISGAFDTSAADSQISTTENHGNFPQMFESVGESRFDESYK